MSDLVPATEVEETGKWKERRKVYVDTSVSPQRVIDAVVIVGGDGEVSDPRAGYGYSNADDDGEPVYYGFERSDGAWYIMRLTITAGDQVAEYLKGASDLSTSWGTRVTNSYDTFANTF